RRTSDAQSESAEAPGAGVMRAEPEGVWNVAAGAPPAVEPGVPPGGVSARTRKAILFSARWSGWRNARRYRASGRASDISFFFVFIPVHSWLIPRRGSHHSTERRCRRRVGGVDHRQGTALESALGFGPGDRTHDGVGLPRAGAD